VDVSEARPGIDWEELGRRFTAHNNALQAAGQPQLTWRQFMKLVQKGGGGEAPPAAGVPVPRGPAPTPGAPPAAEALVEPTRTGVPATVARAAWNRMVELFPKELPELVKAFRESTGTKPKSKASKWASQTELEGPLADWLLSDMATRHSDLKDYQLLLERARTVIRKATPKPEAPPEGGVPPAAPVPEGPSGGPAAPPASPAPTPAAGARPAPRASREAAAAAKAVEVGSDNPVEVVRRQLVSRTPSGDALLAELTEGMAKKSSAFQIAKLLEGKSSKYHAKAKTIGERLIREREMGPKAVLEEKAAADGPDSAAAKALARMNEETARAVETLKRDSEDIRTGRKPPPMSDKSARITKGAVDEGFQQAQANLWHQIDSLEDQILDAMDTRGPEYERLKAEQARLLDLYETAWEGAVKRTGDSDLVQGWRDDLEGEPTPRQQTSLKRGAEQTVRNEERRQSEQAPILKAAGVLPKPTVEEVITQRVKAIKGNKAASAAVDVENQRVLDAYRAEADRVFGPEAGQLQAAFDAGKWPKDTSYESNYWNNKIAERLKQTPGEVFERVHGHKVGEPKPATPPVPKSKASSPEAVAARKARRDANWAEVEKSAAALKEETGVVQKHVARGAAALTRATEKLGRTPKPTLPRDLAGAKPRYNIGPNEYHPTFESDLDKAAYITAQKKPSLRDADYLKFVQRETGWSEAAVRAHGAKVRAALKEAVKDADDEGRVTLPDQMPDQSNPTAPVPKSKAAKARAAAQKKSPEAAVGGKFEDVFTKIKDEKKGRPQTYAKTTQADERTWAGLIDGKKVVVRTRPRTITEGESFLTPGNMRLRDSKVGQGGHFVDVEVLEGDSPAVRTKLQQLVEGSDTRPVLVRGKGEPFRTGHPGMPAAATRTTETAGTPRELMHRFGDATARAVRAMLDMEPWGPDAHPEDIALQEASAKLLHRMNGPKVRAELTPKEARILADHFRELADSPALLPEFEKGNSPNQQVRYAFSNFADKLETIAEPKPPPPPKSKAAKARAAKVQPAEPAEAPVSPAERAALKALQQRATSLESYESAADGAYTDAERAAATKEAAKLHEQWLDAMDKVRKQHGDEAGDVLHDNLLDEVWKDHRANMNKDGSLKVRPEPAAVPKSKAAAAREAKAAADAKAARDAEIDDVFQKPDPKTTKARMTKEIRNELQRILDEFDAQPYQGRVWTETPREDNYDPNRGKYTITAGHEGAPVFHDIREQTPALRRKGKVTEGTQVTRKVVEDAVRQLLDTGTVTRPLHEGALRVAELRAGSRKPGNFGRGISKPIIDAWWRERKEDVPFDVPKVKLTPEEEAQAARETEPLKGRAAREREAARKAAKKKR
jgi:hypothetical protein